MKSALLFRPLHWRSEDFADAAWSSCCEGLLSLSLHELFEQLAPALVLTSPMDSDRDIPQGRNAALADVKPASRHRETIAEIVPEDGCSSMLAA